MVYSKEKLKKYFFEFDNGFSYDYYIDIIDTNHMDSPSLILEKVRVPGAMKDTFYSEGTYENKIIDIKCYVDVRHDIKRKDIHIKRIKQWLNTGYKYKKLRFSDDNGFYEGVCISNMLFEEVVEGLYRTLISFNCAPYKIKNPTVYKLGYNEEVKCINEGFFASPLKVKIDYINNTVCGFTIKILKEDKELYNFNCNAPESGTKYLKIDSEELDVKAYDNNLNESSAINIINSTSFPWVETGDIKIQFIPDCLEANSPIATFEFNELEL